MRLLPDRRYGGKRLVPTPELVGCVLAQVPRGEVITLAELVARLKQKYGGDRIGPQALDASLRDLERDAAACMREEHEPRVPMWRLVQNDGSVDPRSELKPLFSAARLREEGHCVAWDDDRWKVLDLHH